MYIARTASHDSGNTNYKRGAKYSDILSSPLRAAAALYTAKAVPRRGQ